MTTNMSTAVKPVKQKAATAAPSNASSNFAISNSPKWQDDLMQDSGGDVEFVEH